VTKLGTSQNGWPVYDDATFRDHAVKCVVEGISVPMWAANDDVGTVLQDFAEWFHHEIEPLDMPVKEVPHSDDWSRALRAVRGQTTGFSNHGSCTAWDLNATRHPRGVKNTYSPANRAKLRAKIATYDGVLRHGEFYTGTIDGMHVEINDSAAAVHRVAERIRATNQAAQEAADMELTDKIKLSAAAAKAMGRKEGEELSLSHFIQWGGPGLYQANARLVALTKHAAAQQAALNTISAAVTQLAAGSSPGVRDAFTEGIAALKAELADIDVHVTLDDGDDTPKESA